MSRSLASSPRNHYLSPSKLGNHEQRLRNCKRMFDQLHRTHMNTFNNRKQRLQNHWSMTPVTTSNNEEYQIHANKHSSMSEPKNHRNDRKKPSEDNQQIVQKMLEVSGTGRRGGFKGLAKLLGQQSPTVYQFRNDSNQSKLSTGYTGSSALKKISSRERSHYKNKSQHKQQRIGWKNQDTSLAISKQKIHQMNKQSEMQKKANITASSFFTESIGLNLNSYIQFINSPPEIRELNIQFNFTGLRKMTAADAWKNLDFRNGKLIENLLDSILQNLATTPVNSELVKDHCWLYFNNYEKAKLQIILKQHYFKLFAFKLNPIFVLQRIAMYFCYLACNKTLLTQKFYIERITNSISLLKQIYSIILNVVKQIQITKPTLNSIINVNINKGNQQVEETFQILRSVGQVQKYIGDLQDHLEDMIRQNQVREFYEINRVMSCYMVEEVFGIGKRTYENFIKSEMLLSWKYLHLPPTPFLPPIKPQYKYTIVLDLDETIIYYQQQSKLLKFRPFLDIFFKTLQAMKIQIICFSASSKAYADAVIYQLQRKRRIFQYRLYRDHLSLYQSRMIKDIRRLGRDLSKTILVDDLSVNFSSCKENGIEVSSWHGEKDDQQLLRILEIIDKIEKAEELERNNLKIEKINIDVRLILKEYRKIMQKVLDPNQANEIVDQK